MGLCPAVISKLLAREWGQAFTREAMLSGRSVSAAELRNMGTVHGLAEDLPNLEQLTCGYLENLHFSAPRASTMCKEVMKAAYPFPGKDQQQETIKRVFREMMASDAESAIGVRNFQQKRKTDWDDVETTRRESKL